MCADAGRIASRDESGTAWRTYRSVRETAREAHPLRRQSVDVRRDGIGVSVAAQLRSHIFTDYQHDIGRMAPRRSVRTAQGQCHKHRKYGEYILSPVEIGAIFLLSM